MNLGSTKTFKHKLSFLLLLLFLGVKLLGQEQAVSPSSLYTIDERKFVETKWRYTYTIHLESNTIIHQADEDYDFYLHWRYDYTFEQFLNGKFSKGTWSLKDVDLFFQFKHINKFIIAELDKKTLVLEFTQPNSKGTYQYHFIRVESKDAPFIKPANELPDVNVEALNPNKKKRNWLAFAKKKRKNKKSKKRNKNKDEKDRPYISIELIGGGYYGGVDPVVRDYIQIKSDGRLIKEFKSRHNGLIVTKKNITRDELEQFAEFIVAQKFFEFERMYDCESILCQERKHDKPTPIPLRLAVAYGQKKKVITISIWGKDESKRRYVEYPPALDNIIDAIQKMAHRI